MNAERSGYRNIFWMTSIVLADSVSLERTDVIKQLREAKIDSRPFFHPMGDLPMFERRENPVARRLCARGINLPSGYHLQKEQVAYISDTIARIVNP